jgi:hypothetical protein
MHLNKAIVDQRRHHSRRSRLQVKQVGFDLRLSLPKCRILPQPDFPISGISANAPDRSRFGYFIIFFAAAEPFPRTTA